LKFFKNFDIIIIENKKGNKTMITISDFDRELIEEVLKELFDSGFAAAIKENDMWEWFNNKRRDFDNLYINTDGATKYVIDVYDSDYVVKISRCGMNEDYCLTEYENYKKAVENELDWAFPKTDLFGIYDGIKVFIQEKVDCDEDGIENEFFSYAETNYTPEISKEEDEDAFYSEVWKVTQQFDIWDALRAVFGECEETNRLCRFCRDNDINDLHSHNFGRIGDRIYVIDFCGYRS
jgi:hypothetical protein